MTGMQLAADKVEKLVIMGGGFQGYRHRLDNNITYNLPAAQNVTDNWPGEIVYVGMEIGNEMWTGQSLTDPEINPVAMAWYLYPLTAGGANNIGRRHSWDPTALPPMQQKR